MALDPAGCDDGLEFGHLSFQLVDLGACTRQHLRLDIEFLTGDQLEAAQSLRQNIFEVGAQILMRLCHPWRNQRHKSQGNLVDILPVHREQRLELVDMDNR